MGGWIGFYYGIAIETVSLIKNPFILSMFSMSTYEFLLSWFLPILQVLLRGIRGRGPQLHCGSPDTWGVGFWTIFKYLQPVPHSCQHWHKHAKRVPETSRSRKWSCITKYEQPPFASIGEAKELIPTTSSTFLKHGKTTGFSNPEKLPCLHQDLKSSIQGISSKVRPAVGSQCPIQWHSWVVKEIQVGRCHFHDLSRHH